MAACGQGLTSAGALIGYLSCLLGVVSPYWRSGQMSSNSTGFHDGLSSISQVTRRLDYHGGLFYFCVDIPGGGSECDLYQYSSGGTRELEVLWMVVAHMSLGLIFTVTSCFCLCRVKEESNWFRCQGIFSGLVGLCGVVVTIMYLLSPGDVWNLKLHSLSPSWSLACFVAGTGSFLLISLGLCIATPNGFCPCFLSRRKGYEDIEKTQLSQVDKATE